MDLSMHLFLLWTGMYNLTVVLSFSHTQPFFFCKENSIYAYTCLFIYIYWDWRCSVCRGGFKWEEEIWHNCLLSLWHCRELSRGIGRHQSRIQPERGVLATRNSSALVFTLFTSAQDICTTSGTVKCFTKYQTFCAGNAEVQLRTASSLSTNDPKHWLGNVDLERAVSSYFGLSCVSHLAYSCGAGDPTATFWQFEVRGSCEGKTDKVKVEGFCLKPSTYLFCTWSSHLIMKILQNWGEISQSSLFPLNPPSAS